MSTAPANEQSPLVESKIINSFSPISNRDSWKRICSLLIAGAAIVACAAFSGFRIVDFEPNLTHAHLTRIRSPKRATDTRGHPSNFPTLEWKRPACKDSSYDFVGSIQFCTTKINHELHIGYRLDKHQPCGIGLSPVIRMKPGYSYQLRLENDSKYPTNIHPHGLHVSGDGNSDDIDRVATEKGSCLFYNWTLGQDHPDGTFWYHAHAHKFSKSQVSRGAYGMLIVDPSDDQIHEPNRPSFLQQEERILLVGATRLSKTQSYHTANGFELGQRATIDLSANQWTRLRVMIADSNSIMRNVLFDDSQCETRVLAHDGVWRSSVPGPARSVFQLSGASRVDVAIKCASSSGIWYDTDETNSPAFVDIVVADDARDKLESDSIERWIPERPQYLSSLVEKPGAQDGFSVTMTSIYLNGFVFDAATPLDKFEFGTLHEWRIHNSSWHPFHLHTYQMQVVSPGGCGYMFEEGEWYDTISKPKGMDDEPCVVRFQTSDFGGRLVMHCHILGHQDSGMMGWVDIVGGPEPGLTQIPPQHCTSACF